MTQTIKQIEDFWQWAEKELEIQQLNWYRVEKIAGLSNATISKRARELLPPTDTSCRAIAQAFHLDPEYVFRRAGLLPPQPPRDDNFEAALFLFRQLSEEDQEKMLAFIRTLVEIQAKNP